VIRSGEKTAIGPTAAFTLDNYGHLFDDSLGPHLSLGTN